MWVAVLNGLVGSIAAFGADHDLMQRLLTVETRRESQITLALTPLGTHYLWVSRLSVVIFGVVRGVLAYAFSAFIRFSGWPSRSRA